MNRLTEFRADMKFVLDNFGYGRSTSGAVLMETVDALIAELEPVEVWHHLYHSGIREQWYAKRKLCAEEPGGEFVTIYVPRKPEPTLLEAAEVIAGAWGREEFHAGGYLVGSPMDGAFDALEAAIKREKDND